MENKETQNPEQPTPDSCQAPGRRDALDKLGRFAMYAAPFTVLALSQKADAATGHGPGKHP